MNEEEFMDRTLLRLALTAAILMGAATIIAQQPPVPEVPADARFDTLKSLEGRWQGKSAKEDGHQGVFEYRVIAGGSVVEERTFAGTPMEMVTLYHLDGTELVASHFCMLGNHPRFVVAEGSDASHLEFDCAGLPINAESHDSPHVHGFRIEKLANDSVRVRVDILQDGQVLEEEFVLTRQS